MPNLRGHCDKNLVDDAEERLVKSELVNPFKLKAREICDAY